MAGPIITLRLAAERHESQTAGSTSRHQFSFGDYYDPLNTSFGVLTAHNDNTLSPGGGFGAHRHRDTEIVTWMIAGRLRHEDSTGRRGTIGVGDIQRMSAGRGVVHSERDASETSLRGTPETWTRFVQMWLEPDEPGGDTSYQQTALEPDLLASSLTMVASGRPADRDTVPITLGQRGAALYAGFVPSNESRQLPDARWLHLYVVDGCVCLEAGQELGPGDSALVSDAGGMRLVATHRSQVLVWQMERSLHPALTSPDDHVRA